MEKIETEKDSDGKIIIEVNQKKLNELLLLAEEPISPDMVEAMKNRAEEIAREAFGGYDVGRIDDNKHYALYDGIECIGESEPKTKFYNPNIDWESVEKALKAIWKVEQNINK